MNTLTQTILNQADYETSKRLGLTPTIEGFLVESLEWEENGGYTYEQISAVLKKYGIIVNY
jgi:hypothetical protein